MNNKFDYRPDIDGLRAIAVLGVVLYHANASWVPGGYVGVDVFFVISGFLITSILFRQSAEGRFSIVDFYERRIRRIVPALTVVLIAALLVGLWTLPWDFYPLVHSAKYVVISISNVHFNKVTEGYFGATAEDMPLLHTWSLGVEEQYYLIVPLFFWLAVKRPGFRKWIGWIFMLAGAASFGLAAWWIRRHPSDAFFLLPYRAWELAVGAMLAWWATARPRSQNPWGATAGWLPHLVGLSGLGMILWAMFRYDKSTLFPGPAALLPCTGAALVLAADIRKRHAAGWLLGLRPVVFVGLISYSVYLWHWPVLVFHRYFVENRLWEPEFKASAGVLVGLSLLLGAASWWGIERPFRSRKIPIRPIIITSIAFTVLVSVFAVIADKTDGLVDRMPPAARRMLAAQEDWSPDAKAQDPSSLEHPFIYGDHTTPPTIALWGDSHAIAVAHELGEMAREHGTTMVFYGQSSDAPMLNAWCPRKELWEYNQKAMARICASASIQKVVLVGRWAIQPRGYMGEEYGPADRGRPTNPLMVHPDGSPVTDLAEADALFANSLRATLAQLRQAGKTVFLVYPIPETGHHIPRTFAREIICGRAPAAYRIDASHAFFDRQSPVLALFDSIPEDSFLVKLKPHERLIANDGSIRLLDGEHPLYRDGDHLSLHGARKLKPMFEAVFSAKGAAQ